MAWPNWIGSERYWTRERVIEALKKAAAEIDGPLPCGDKLYLSMKGLDWPPLVRVYGYFGSIPRGWLNAGVDKARVTLKNVPYTSAEDAYILEHAGKKSLEEIAQYLRRTRNGVKTRLNRCLRVRARDNQGLYSAAELAKEYNCPYHRVCDALAAGKITATFDDVRNRWQVDLTKLTPSALAILKAPKTKSYKNSPPDVGNYYERYGLRRKLIDGRVVVVSR